MERLLVFALVLISCGPSKEELRAREDSLRNAIEKAAIQRLEQITSLKESIKNKEDVISAKSNLLIVRKADLEAARDKMFTIKKFQLLRLPEEREQQVRSQAIVIEQLENDVVAIANRIENEKKSLSEIRQSLAALE